MPNLLLAPVLRWFGKLSYPRLFLLTAALFVANVFVLDPIPFVDELLLGLGALLLANWKNRGVQVRDKIDGESTRR
jgi:hypothetical protein